MPDSDNPKVSTWVPYMAKVVGKVDKDTYFIGHSVGCFTILHYLETLKKDEKIGGCVFVGPWLKLKEWEGETDEEKKIVKHWENSKLDFYKIKQHSPKYVAIFSDNDPFVPLSNGDAYRKELGAKVVVEHDKGHFNDESNIKKLPSALEALLAISK